MNNKLNSKNIINISNIRDGKSIVMIGNGPSLCIKDLNSIRNYHTLAINHIDHVYDSTSWRPTYYLNTAVKLTQNHRKSIRNNIDEGIICFINSEHKTIFGMENNIYYIDFLSVKRELTNLELSGSKINDMSIAELYNYWSDDIFDCVYTYHSMYAALQIASHLGFKNIFLIGTDLNFGYHDSHMIFDRGIDPMKFSNGPRNFARDGIWPFLKTSIYSDALLKSLINLVSFIILFTPLALIYYNALINLGIADDPNHFISSYTARPRDLRYVNEQTINSHYIANRILTNKAIDVYNATEGGNLEVYPRIDIDAILKN